MMLARGRHILIGLIALSTVVAGVGYSAFSFRETAEDSTSADPSPDNIRENFIFGNDSDSNVLTTKYYTVNFYAQYLGYNDGNSLNLAGDGSDHYDCDVAGGPLLSNGYSHYLGFFKEGSFDADKIESLGGEVTYLKDATPANELENDNGYVNCITFHNVSAITQEMLQAIRCPVFTDDDLSKNGNNMSNGLVDNSGWVLKFISWVLVPSTGGPNLYSNLKVYPQGPNKFQVDGSYPTSGFTVPNFNLSLSHYDAFKTENVDGKIVINVFPLLSTGKDYTKVDTKDAIALSFPKTTTTNENGEEVEKLKDVGADYLGTDFAYDPTMTINTDSGVIDAYRFPGLSIKDYDSFKNSGVYIGDDMDLPSRDVYYEHWFGTYIPLAKQDLYTCYEDRNASTLDATNAFDISNSENGIRGAGRYNLYLFVKRTDGSWERNRNSDEHDTSPIFSEIVNKTAKIDSGEIEQINKRLDENKIHPYLKYDLGVSFIYNIEWGQHILWWYTDDKITYYSADFYLVVEKTFDIKLVGSESETWDYGKAPLSPGFNQMVEESEGSLTILDEYEVRDVTMDGNKYTTFSQDGLGKLILPQTFFGIGIDSNSSSFDLDTVDLAYETSSVTSEVKPIGQIVNGSVVPDVEVPSVETLSFASDGNSIREPYFSKTFVPKIDSEGKPVLDDNQKQIFELDEDWSLLSLSEWCSLNPESEEVMLEDANGNLRPLAEAYSDPNIKSKIDQLKIFRVPATGEYNFYVKLDYSNSKISMTLYFYRIHNIFVKILKNDAVPVNPDTNYVDTDYADAEGKDAFYTSSANYFLLDTLKLDDEFNDSVTQSVTLGKIYLDKQSTITENGENQSGYCYVLCDTVSGQYALPTSIERGEFVIHKNHILEWKFKGRDDVGWTNADDALLSGYSSNGGAA